ncbi:MAG: hypothetical protein HZC49_12375 [Nitrospirae bacterium]|nr:hypothetical protein [Nitrospirota bacterium]
MGRCFREKINILKSHSNNVEAISYSAGDKYLLSGSHDNTMTIWDAKTGNYIDTLAGHAQSICTMSFVPGSNILASGDCIGNMPFGIPVPQGGCKIIFWDVEAAKQIKAIEGDCGLSCAAFSPDGKYFVTGHATGGRFITVYERK